MERLNNNNNIFKTLRSGVVNVSKVNESRFSNIGFNTRMAVEKASKIQESETGRTFYRLGEEFLSQEVLSLISQRYPQESVRDEAKRILENIGTPS